MANYVRVVGVTEVPPGTGIVASVNGKEYAVFNVSGTFYAIDNACVHRGGPLGDGALADEVVTCPWHAWEYNVKTGACLTRSDAKVACYDVRVENDEVKIAI